MWLNYAAGNRDPRTFDRAEEFVVDRPENAHLAFGHGIDACVGSRLARLELRVVTEDVLRRTPDLVATVDAPEYRLGRRQHQRHRPGPRVVHPRAGHRGAGT